MEQKNQKKQNLLFSQGFGSSRRLANFRGLGLKVPFKSFGLEQHLTEICKHAQNIGNLVKVWIKLIERNLYYFEGFWDQNPEIQAKLGKTKEIY